MRLRFRLSSLLAVITVLAIGMSLWLGLVAPNVARVSFSRYGVTLHMTPAYAERAAAEMHLATSPNQTYVHDVYVGIPVYIMAVILVVAVGGTWATCLVVKRAIRHRQSSLAVPPESR